eukprot:11632692-Alexandrium_andersonii.AAC.1
MSGLDLHVPTMGAHRAAAKRWPKSAKAPWKCSPPWREVNSRSSVSWPPGHWPSEPGPHKLHL